MRGEELKGGALVWPRGVANIIGFRVVGLGFRVVGPNMAAYIEAMQGQGGGYIGRSRCTCQDGLRVLMCRCRVWQTILVGRSDCAQNQHDLWYDSTALLC